MTLRILLCLHERPYPPRSGGDQRDMLLYHALSKLGTVRTLLFLPDGLDEQGQAVLREHVGLVGVEPRPRVNEPPPSRLGRALMPLRLRLPGRQLGLRSNRRMIRAVRRAVAQEQIDLVVLRPLELAMRFSGLSMKRVLVDVDDMPSERCLSRLRDAPHMSRLRKVVLAADARVYRRAQRRTFAQLRTGWIVSPDHADRVAGGQYTWLPNIPYCFGPGGAPQVQPADDASQVVLFVGPPAFPINRDGLQRFIAGVWPQVRQRCPQARLRIVGKVKPEDPLDWARAEGVELAGFVDDLVAEYRQCAFTVAPIYGGTGTNIKVLETLAYGRTCAMSPFAQRGYQGYLVDGRHVRVCGDDQTFAAACVELLHNPNARRELAAAGQKVIDATFNFDTFSRIVAEQVAQVMG